MNKAAALKYFGRSLAWMEHSNYSELERFRNLQPADVTPQYFLSTYARVVLAAGFGTKILDRLSPALETAFRGYDIEAIAGSTNKVTRAALRVLNHRKKIEAIVAMARRLAAEDWPAFIRSLTGPRGLEVMESFYGIGRVNKYHLARNIGLDYAKPDRQLERLARKFGYGAHPDGVSRMVNDIVDATGERSGVVDVVLWRHEVMGRPAGGPN